MTNLVLEDPRVQAALAILRKGHADCGERLRPDGFLRLHALLACGPVQRSGCTEADLASLPTKLGEHVGAMKDDIKTGLGTGEMLLRALDGHAAEVRVDTTLKITPLGAPDFETSSLPSELTFCSSFREWNAVRSHGCGAGRSAPSPIGCARGRHPQGSRPHRLADGPPTFSSSLAPARCLPRDSTFSAWTPKAMAKTARRRPGPRGYHPVARISWLLVTTRLVARLDRGTFSAW